jgi:hypothetical protein
VGLTRSEKRELDSFVEELGLSYQKLYHASSETYLFSNNGQLNTSYDDDDSDGLYWTRSADGSIENWADGKLYILL